MPSVDNLLWRENLPQVYLETHHNIFSVFVWQLCRIINLFQFINRLFGNIAKTFIKIIIIITVIEHFD